MTLAHKQCANMPITDAGGTRDTNVVYVLEDHDAYRWHQCCQWGNGDFGTSPFFRQLAAYVGNRT